MQYNISRTRTNHDGYDSGGTEMIFYFTCTGNSEYVARRLVEKTGGDIVSISESVKERKNKFYLADGEILGFVFPVYAFDIPEIVSSFIKSIELENYSDQYVFTVLTCGANVGVACDNLKKILADKNITLNYAHNIIMPESYIVLFDPGQPEKQENILAAADKDIDRTVEAVTAGAEAMVIDGKNPPKFAARLVSHLFNKYARGTKKFRVTDDCTSCGACEKICPVSVIVMNGGRPEWREEMCAKCMACINRCPAHAIEYGGWTKKRERYVHPIYRNNL